MSEDFRCQKWARDRSELTTLHQSILETNISHCGVCAPRGLFGIHGKIQLTKIHSSRAIVKEDKRPHVYHYCYIKTLIYPANAKASLTLT